MICGQPVDEEKEWNTNGAVHGKYIPITGHQKCVTNMNNLIIIPNTNRIRMFDLEEKTPKGELSYGEAMRAINEIVRRYNPQKPCC